MAEIAGVGNEGVSRRGRHIDEGVRRFHKVKLSSRVLRRHLQGCADHLLPAVHCFRPLCRRSVPSRLRPDVTQDTSTYTKVFEKVHELVPDFTPSNAIADFEEASVSAFRQVFGAVSVGGCWFHYAQAVIKRVNKLGLKTEYCSDDDVKNTVHSLISLPLLPPGNMHAAVSDIKSSLNADSPHINRIQQLITYVNQQWIDKSSIRPERLSVRDNRSRTNNVLESYHARGTATANQD